MGQHNGTFYLGTDFGIWRSADRGVTWEKTTKDTPGVLLWMIRDFAPMGDTLIVNTHNDVYFFNNNGTVWQKTVAEPPAGIRGRCVTFGNTIFITSEKGLFSAGFEIMQQELIILLFRK